MAPKRPRKPARAFCPSCDEPLETTLAESDDPTCPKCAAVLLPTVVAGFWRRLGGGLIDSVVLILTAGALNWLILAIVGTRDLVDGPWGMDAMLQFLAADPFAVLLRMAPFLAMSALYLVLFWSLTGQTLGQRFVKVRVIGRGGRPPGPLPSAVRAIVLGLGLVPGALGSLWMAFDMEKRSLHDHLAGTYVVKAA